MNIPKHISFRYATSLAQVMGWVRAMIEVELKAGNHIGPAVDDLINCQNLIRELQGIDLERQRAIL